MRNGPPTVVVAIADKPRPSRSTRARRPPRAVPRTESRCIGARHPHPPTTPDPAHARARAASPAPAALAANSFSPHSPILTGNQALHESRGGSRWVGELVPPAGAAGDPAACGSPGRDRDSRTVEASTRCPFRRPRAGTSTSTCARRSSKVPPLVRPYLSDTYWCHRDGCRGSPPTIQNSRRPRVSEKSTNHSTWASSQRRASPLSPPTPQAASRCVPLRTAPSRSARADSQAPRARPLSCTTDGVATAQRFDITTSS